MDPLLLQYLVCPRCKGGLTLVDGEQGLQCAPCALVYPVREGIPVMLVDEAVPTAGEDKTAKSEEG